MLISFKAANIFTLSILKSTNQIFHHRIAHTKSIRNLLDLQPNNTVLYKKIKMIFYFA